MMLKESSLPCRIGWKTDSCLSSPVPGSGGQEQSSDQIPAAANSSGNEGDSWNFAFLESPVMEVRQERTSVDFSTIPHFPLPPVM